MTYLIQDEMATNAKLNSRVAQCAAQENAPGDPDRWSYENRRKWASSPGWDDSWAYSKAVHPEMDYDPGVDEAVITDGAILATVQGMITAP